MPDGMTRAKITSTALSLVKAHARGPMEMDPILADTMLDWVVHDICRIAESVELEFTTPIVAGQAEYCSPDLKFIESAQIALPAGNTPDQRDLPLSDTRGVAVRGSAWRVDPQEGSPEVAITQGRQRVAVYPTPDYSVGVLTLRGFGVLVNSMWPNDDDVCPLRPSYSHQAVCYGLALKIAEHLREADAIAIMEKNWKSQMNKYWAESFILTEHQRHRGDQGAYRQPSGPLNL